MAILLLAMLVAFGLFWLDPKEQAYLWLGLVCVAMMARAAIVVVGNYSALLSGNLNFILEDVILTPLAIGIWVIFWMYWFRLPSMARIHRMVWSVVVLLGIGMAMLRAPLYGNIVPVHAIVWLSPLTLALKLLLGALLVWITVLGIRKDKVEGWLALIPIVLGDVSGKGLKAAMLVSLMVGAIRMAVEALHGEPMPILEALNRRLCGRMEGHFATCLVARIAPDGAVSIANAGHLPPYLNGNEVAIAGSLPLGIVEDTKFEVAHFTLQPGDRLTLLTDGVLEAMNARRELFGFARVDAAMRGEKSPADIAAEAQAFGQLDDITVVRVTRSAAPVERSVPEPVFVAG